MNQLQRKSTLTQIVALLFELLNDTDSYVYLAAVNGLVAAGDVELQTTLDILLDAFVDPTRPLSQRTKLGEAVALASKRCGDVLPHYAEKLVESFLLCAATGSTYVPSTGVPTVHTGEGAHLPTPQQYKLAVEAFRASCLSNLADVCLTLGTNVKTYAHRICNVVTAMLQLESVGGSRGSTLSSTMLIQVLDAEDNGAETTTNMAPLHQKIGAGRSVRRSATFVLRAVIQASGKNILHILTSHLSPLSQLLKCVASNDTDKVTQYHAQQALYEFDVAVRNSVRGEEESRTKGSKNVFEIKIPGL